MTVLSWLIGSKLGRYTAMALVALAGVGVVLLKTFAAGAKKEKLKQTQQQIKNLREGVKNDKVVNSMSHEQRVDELLELWSK